VTLATRAALLRIDPAMEESARLLGDRRMAVFRRVTIPVVLPAILAGALLAVLYALSDFGAVSLLQFDSLARAIHLQLGASFDRAAAALLALVLVGMTVFVTWGERRVRGRADAYAASAVGRRPPAVVPLGRWRWPAIAFLAIVVGLAVIVPVATIGWWLIRGLLGGETLSVAIEAARDTILVATIAAALGVVLAVPIALLAGRYPSRLARVVETSVFAGYALPGIVVALAMVFLATRSVPILYQTLVLLVGVYAIRFVPQAVGGLRAAVTSTGAHAEEIARTLGDGPARAFLRVTVPAIRPALVAGAALIFVTVAKELPLALLLAPIGFETLATEVWDAASSGFYARAAVPAAILVAVSLAGVGLLLRAEEGPR
jgi:iron(III) transport system permease protein